MIGLRRALVVLPVGVLLALGACDLALGLGDLKDRGPDASVGPAIDSASDDGSPPDAGRREAGPPPPATSCQNVTGPGLTDCGPNGNENCCASAFVEGDENFLRSRDPAYPATVTGFYLDRFEVTVGRFRAFVEAAAGGYRPAQGSGKHVHLNDGRGLAGTNGGNEPGWKSEWNDKLPATRAKWTTDLTGEKFCTWTEPDAGDAPSTGDARPMNCVSWYEAYAFCIWDNAFLPSEAEWNYAASGGVEARVYPWSNPPASNTIDCTHATYGSFLPANGCSDAGPLKVGALSTTGDGRWGQADLGGNVYEWVLDGYSDPYVNPCVDCMNTEESTNRVCRGGAYTSGADRIETGFRDSRAAVSNLSYVGLRCARPF